MTLEMLVIGIVLALFGLLLGTLAVSAIKRLLLIAGPNEVLVFSGSGGRGYKLVRGGRRMRVPLLERVAHMDLTNLTVDVSVENAYSKGGIPLTVQGVANLKVSAHQPQLGHALERFLGMPQETLIRVARDTLEGNLRGVLSQLTPEEVNEDKITFAEKLLEEAEHDLGKLGLTLDVLKIQNVSDEVGYLDSIGRRSTAVLERTATISEAAAKAEAVVQDASARQRARLAEYEAEIEIARAQTETRVTTAVTQREALIAEEVGAVSALIASAQAEVKVQEARVEQVSLRLEADVLAKARASAEAKKADARGRAARIVEEGKATAAVLEDMVDTWKNGGENARDIFLMEKLEKVMTSLVGTIHNIEVDRITLLPQSGGRAADTARLSEELKAAVGVDIPQLVNGLGGFLKSADSTTTQPKLSPVVSHRTGAAEEDGSPGASSD